MFEDIVRNLKIVGLAVLFYLLMTLQTQSSEKFYPEIALIFVVGIGFLLFTGGKSSGGITSAIPK